MRRGTRHVLVGRDAEGHEARRLVLFSAYDAARTAAAWCERDDLRVAVTPAIPDDVRRSVAGERHR